MCDWLAEAHELLADGMQRGGSRVCAALPAKLLRFRSLQSNRRTVHKSFSFKLANCVAKLVGALRYRNRNRILCALWRISTAVLYSECYTYEKVKEKL